MTFAKKKKSISDLTEIQTHNLRICTTDALPAELEVRLRAGRGEVDVRWW